MKIADRTPFRNENGVIDILGRAQGTLKYGFSWYSRVQAQKTVIAALDKVLGSNYVMLRNVTLPETDIDLPLVLLGPPGIYLVNVLHERGVYRARDDEWGKVSGEKFVPAGINHVQRTAKLGRVLQIYLDRAGYKGTLVVDTILMAADPGMHIDSIRPVVRIVMSDAIERFAVSMNQARSVLSFADIKTIAQVIVNGPKKETPSTAPFIETPLTPPAPANSGWDNSETIINPVTQPESSPGFSADSLGFSFDDSGQDEQSSFDQDTLIQEPASAQKTVVQNALMQNTIEQQPVRMESDFQESELRGSNSQHTTQPDGNFETGQPSAPPQTGSEKNSVAQKKKGLFGMSLAQTATLAGILVFWLCAMAALAAYMIFSN